MYKWIRTNESVLRLADNANIPCAPGNTDFKQFQEYVAGGGQVDAADPPPPAIDLSDMDNMDRILKAVGLLMRDYCNALNAGTYTNKSVAQLKADFAAKYNSLP